MKTLLRIFAVSLLIILLVSGGGFVYKFLTDAYDRKTHPLGYSGYVEEYAELYGVPSDIIYAVIRTESSFDEKALSTKGAAGLMQLTPDTFAWLMTKTGEENEPGSIYDPRVNIQHGVFFLGYLYGEFGSWETVYAAYNAGMTRVKDWLRDPAYAEDGRLTRIPFEETENYVKRVVRAAENYKRLYPDK